MKKTKSSSSKKIIIISICIIALLIALFIIRDRESAAYTYGDTIFWGLNVNGAKINKIIAYDELSSKYKKHISMDEYNNAETTEDLLSLAEKINSVTNKPNPFVIGNYHLTTEGSRKNSIRQYFYA